MAKANRPPACLGLVGPSSGGEGGAHAWPLLWPACLRPPASPALAWLRGQVLAQPPPGLGLADSVELVLLRALLLPVPGSSPSAKREAMTSTHVADVMVSHQCLPLTSPWDSRGGGSQGLCPPQVPYLNLRTGSSVRIMDDDVHQIWHIRRSTGKGQTAQPGPTMQEVRPGRMGQVRIAIMEEGRRGHAGRVGLRV